MQRLLKPIKCAVNLSFNWLVTLKQETGLVQVLKSFFNLVTYLSGQKTRMLAALKRNLWKTERGDEEMLALILSWGFSTKPFMWIQLPRAHRDQTLGSPGGSSSSDDDAAYWKSDWVQ